MQDGMGIGDLTPKELEALALIAQGHDAKSAARELSVSAHTIYERLRRAREKLGASNSRAAARLMFGSDSQTNEKFVSENLVLSDVHATRAFADLPGAPLVNGRNPESGLEKPYKGSSYWFEPSTYLPLRTPGERDIRATKIERLRLIGDLSARLALAFVAICLAAMILSTLLQRI
jgi:DNA-binding CsgD family transcriptional regulator